MDDAGEQRPALRLLAIKPMAHGDCYVGRVGMELLNGEREVRGGMIALEDAQRYLDLGYALFLDVEDEARLARWQQINSPRQPWNKW